MSIGVCGGMGGGLGWGGGGGCGWVSFWVCGGLDLGGWGVGGSSRKLVQENLFAKPEEFQVQGLKVPAL